MDAKTRALWTDAARRLEAGTLPTATCPVTEYDQNRQPTTRVVVMDGWYALPGGGTATARTIRRNARKAAQTR